MLKSKSFLAIDFGAGSLKLAEFAQNEAGGLCLKQYGVKALGAEGAQEATREATILKALQQVLAEKNFGTKQINVCAPGFHVFSKFVKLPPVDTSKVTQIIRYEAQQNVPFPLEEVVWDYQILGTSATHELEVLLVAVKSEVVEGLFRVADGAGLRLNLVDVSPAALCNAFRFNYGDLDGCTMLLDIGAKTSNVLFFEKGKVYSRSISIGANAITQEFANEAKIKFPEAEAIKIEKGFVSLGGAYEEPEDPQAAAISKIARQVMTRLHLQVNQTIQFYRSQQGGSAPVRMFLSGGASIMPYTAQFFKEKLNLTDVDYFNPFANIEISPNVDLEDLSKYAHSFGEVVGLGLRDLAHCPVELNLMPKSSIQRREFAQKKPYFIASIFLMALVIFASGWAQSQIGAKRRVAIDSIKLKVEPLNQKDQELTRIKGETERLRKEANELTEIVANRSYWGSTLMSVRQVMLNAEAKASAAMKTNGVDVQMGVWVERFSPALPQGSPFAVRDAFSINPTDTPATPINRRNRQVETTVAPVPAGGSDVSAVNLLCRAVDYEKIPNANAALAYAVKEEFESSSQFVQPIILGDLKKDETNTFVFPITVHLKQPLKF